MSQQSSSDSSKDASLQKPAKTIDDLPEEVLVMILKLLDPKSLDLACLANEKWGEIAQREVPWGLSFDCFNTLNVTLRSFPSMKIESVAMNTHLSFIGDEQTPTASELRKVKKVLLRAYNSDTLQFFDKAQLETLIMLGQPPVYRFSVFALLADNSKALQFFAGQKSLTTLHLVDTDYLFKTPIAVENFPFKLKELALSSLKCGHENVLAFMKLHEDSLETLQLGTCFSAPIYEFVFANLKKLKTLCMIVGNLDIDRTLLKLNPSVTTLKLFERREHCTVVKAVEIIKHLPSIENLVLPINEPYEKLSAVLDHLKQLKRLSVASFDKTFWQDVTFPKLESLTFFDAELDEQSDIALVAKNKNLKSMNFDGVVGKEFLNAISENFPKLVSLDLRKSKVNVDVTSHIRGVRLREEDFYEASSIYGNVFCINELPYVDSCSDFMDYDEWWTEDDETDDYAAYEDD